MAVRILLVGNYPTDRQESMQRFTAMLKTGLEHLDHQVQLIRPEPFVGKLKLGADGLGKWLGYVDKFILFPRQLRQAIQWADVVHICDHANAIYTQYLQEVPHLVTCHDLLAIRSALGTIPENPTKWTGQQLQRLILTGLNQAQRVVCVSEQTRRELLQVIQLDDSVVTVIYNGLNYPYTPMTAIDAQQHLVALKVSLTKPFLLHVGVNNWYKNRLGVLQIFNHLRQQHLADLHLVMVGNPFTQEMNQFVQDQKLQELVTELVAIANEDLRALYSTATALLFPSWQEGFGWPIAEAQACGCPVFTSNRAPMTEVGGDAAIYFDPTQPQAAAQVIAQHLPKVVHLRQAGLLNAQRFATDLMIQFYVQLYTNIKQKSGEKFF